MTLTDYISKVNFQYQTGNTTEHSFRGFLRDYVAEIAGSGINVINEPKRTTCGAPDYVILSRKTNQPVFYIEAKDLEDGDLDGIKSHKEQFDRYKDALEYVVFTDYLDFHFYEHGNFVKKIRLGEVLGNRIAPHEDSEKEFNKMITNWSHAGAKSITKAKDLAEIMASKARLLRFITLSTMRSLTYGEFSYSDKNLEMLFNQFKETLISDLNHERFADMYAQTIVYGLFAARLNDSTPDDFSRSEALNLIPKSNPFLRKIFENVAGNDLDERISWIVDDLVETFAATDVQKIMEQYGQNTQRNDPMVHFYEDFLEKYDNKLRKQMGVWYTPKPIVSFIVRSIDEILRNDFALKDGLADRTKTEIDEAIDQSKDGRTTDGKKHRTVSVPKVQILDPATGTGTFLATTIQQIYHTICKNNNQGIWQEYVDKELKPRLNGFELMVAPYTIAHIKLEMTLKDTGYKENGERRLKVFLTNSLEEPSDSPRDLFSVISQEASDADKVKRDMPVMVILGNPPYNVSSVNKRTWITNLIKEYTNVDEKNKQPLSDDYIKFIRLSQSYIDKNGEGVVGMVTNNTYIDGVLHRAMRKSLLKSFDKIYILDLHGSVKKGEKCPDGSKDENVFDIQQGVGIVLLIKNCSSHLNQDAKVFHYDLFGSKKNKFDLLEKESITSLEWSELHPSEPYFYFMPKDFSNINQYQEGFKISELFSRFGTGIATYKDEIVVRDTRNEVRKIINDFCNLSVEEIKGKYHISKESDDWSVSNAKRDLNSNRSNIIISPYLYRPFDTRFIAYTGISNGFISRPRYNTINSLLFDNNVAICSIRIGRSYNFPIFASSVLTDKTLLSSKDNCSVFPLYIYDNEIQTANFHEDIFNKICSSLGFEPTPEQLFNYIYAILHCPSYRTKYKEFLKIDFPRIPYPTDKSIFGKLSQKGEALVNLHLMKNANSWSVSTGFPVSGSNEVKEISFDEGRVYINEDQYFDNVDSIAWNLFIGGYQPAQKWLKDRKGRTLGLDGIEHYERIIYALDKTHQIMDEIDDIWKPLNDKS